jgi:O-antigen/teichoic acid export membrane protein
MGAKWKPAVPPLEILSVYATVRSITALVPPVLIALGNPQFVLWNDVAATFILGISFYVGSHWGINGIAWGWVVGYPFVAAPLYWKTFKTIKMNPWEYFPHLYSPLEATVMMAIAVWLTNHAIASNPYVLVRLIAQVVVGVIVYTGVLWIRDRKRIMFIIHLAKRFRPLGEWGQGAKTNA